MSELTSHSLIPPFSLSVDLKVSQREELDDAPFWDEVKAFKRLSRAEVDVYIGRYVAVYQGSIVDSDPDEGELALRFYRTFGYVPVYIHKVGTEDGLVELAEDGEKRRPPTRIASPISPTPAPVAVSLRLDIPLHPGLVAFLPAIPVEKPLRTASFD
jgi:hypothetical protein